MSKTNKNKKVFYMCASIVMYILGLLLLCIGSFNDKLEFGLPGFAVILIGGLGVIFLLLAIGCMVLYMKHYVNSNEELVIEEQDERNIMIRRKAAELTIPVIVVLLFVVEAILILLGDTRAAIIISIASFIGVNVQMYLILYFQKKY